jgi:HD-like signal output (HDOD) protein
VQRGQFDYPEGAFAAGLLHDLGRLMIATSCPDQYLEAANQARATNRRLEEIESGILEVNHAELSAAALNRWGLPPAVQSAALYHHRSTVDPTAQGSLLPLSRAVELADHLAVDAGYRVDDYDPGIAQANPEVVSAISLSEHGRALEEELEREIQAMRTAA